MCVSESDSKNLESAKTSSTRHASTHRTALASASFSSSPSGVSPPPPPQSPSSDRSCENPRRSELPPAFFFASAFLRL